MNLDSRVGWLALGSIIGFVFGYIVCSLREIQDAMHDVDTVVKKEHKHNKGWVDSAWTMNTALFLVVLLTIWASFSSQKASNDVETAQINIKKTTQCNQSYLGKVIKALNGRTEFNKQQNIANVELQRAQSKFLSAELIVPRQSQEKLNAALSKYYDAVTAFVNASQKAQDQQSTNPYPTANELNECIMGKGK